MSVVLRRLESQQLVGTGARSAHALVKRFGAVQGQEYGPTKWGLGLRLPGVVDADIEQQLNRGLILRTHVVRPTWHLVAREDIRWLLQLTGPRVHQLNGFAYRSQGVDVTAFRAFNRLIEKTLGGGRHLSRDAIKDVLARNRMPAEGIKLGVLLMQAELDGLICSGPRERAAHTYALLDERVPATAPKSRDEALAELTDRYFRSRGPATVRDFATWSSLTMADCRRGIAMWEGKLRAWDTDAGPMFGFVEDDAREAPDVLHLLPIYDEYVMGYKDRSAMLQSQKQLGGPPFRFDSMIVRRGQIVGTWRRDIGKASIDLVWSLFQKPDARVRRMLAAAGERFGEFHGLPVTLTQFDPSSSDKKHRAGWAFSN